MCENEELDIVVPVIPRIGDAFERFKKGKFISRESLSQNERRLYGVVDRYREAYEAFFSQINYRLNSIEEYGVFYLSQVNKPGQSQASQFMSHTPIYLSLVRLISLYETTMHGNVNGCVPGDIIQTSLFLKFIEGNSDAQSIVYKFPNAPAGGKLVDCAMYVLKVLVNRDFFDVSDDGSKYFVKSSYGYMKDYYVRTTLLREYARYNTGRELERSEFTEGDVSDGDEALDSAPVEGTLSLEDEGVR